jgi:hypothetical protein
MIPYDKILTCSLKGPQAIPLSVMLAVFICIRDLDIIKYLI